MAILVTVDFLEWMGYLASLIVLVSLVMSSIKKLRWINLIGSLLFAIYGFIIGAIPVGVMNVGIVLINVYYLVGMYKSSDYFNVLEVDAKDAYLTYFMDFYKDNMAAFMDVSTLDFSQSTLRYFVLRNSQPAGLFVATAKAPGTLAIDLDYVIPAYRDFKVANFLFENQKETFKQKGYHTFVATSTKKEHIHYLLRMGFTPSENNTYIKTL